MYLSATMTIDPAQLSQVRRKPTKGFRRFAELLTGNLLSKQEEHETFTALSIMQEINVVLRSVGVKDVVKFVKDDQTLYEDTASHSADDIHEAIDSLSRDVQLRDGAFHRLSLLLEHHLDTLALIIEVKILRIHPIGVYPIQIAVNGLDVELQAVDGSVSLDQRLEEIFETQQSYDDYVEAKRSEFDGFVKRLEEAFRGRMRIDNLHSRVYSNIVRPGIHAPGQAKSRKQGQDSTDDSNSPPMLQRHDCNSDTLMYVWLWSSMMHSNNTHCRDSTIVSEDGQPVFSVGPAGFNAGDGSTLEPNAPFETPDCPIEPVEGVDGEIRSELDFGLFDDGTATLRDSSWFDSFAFDGDVSGGDVGGDGGGAGCGSSCGGGCGGGGCGGGCGS